MHPYPCINRYLIKLILLVSFLEVYASGANAYNLPASANGSEIKTGTDKYEMYCQIAENSKDADSIIYYGNLAMNIAKKIGRSQARPMILMGDGYLQSGKLPLALKYFTSAANQYRDDNNDIGIATAYTYISEVYINQGNHLNAKSYLKKAIKIFQDEKDSIRLASAFHNLGYEYYRVEEYDSALLLFSKSQRIYHNLDHQEGYAYCLGNSGLVYARQMKFDEAEKYLLDAIKILDGFEDERAVTDFMIEYARVLEQKGKVDDAVRYASKSYQVASKNKIIELKRDAALCLSHLYKSANQYDSAYYFQSLFMSLSDSINNLASIQKMADLRTEFEVAQKQAEVDLLTKEKISQLIVIGALVLIILLAGGLILLYYNSLKRVRKFTGILEERRKMLEHQSTELRNLNDIKDRFFSIISHDLRGPISSLGGISFMIKESLESENKVLLHEIADYIDQTVISLSGLLENLLNWALSQQGQLPLNEEKIDTKKLVNEVVKLFTTVSISKHIRIKLKLKDNLFVRGDNNSIMTIIRNLLSNAFKFTNMGGQIEISSRKHKEGMIEIKISDNGIGIPADKLSWLFQLEKVKSTRGTEKEKGIGLGLTLVHEFVKLNKGDIKVQSIVGKGTSFTLFFLEYK